MTLLVGHILSLPLLFAPQQVTVSSFNNSSLITYLHQPVVATMHAVCDAALPVPAASTNGKLAKSRRLQFCSSAVALSFDGYLAAVDVDVAVWSGALLMQAAVVCMLTPAH